MIDRFSLNKKSSRIFETVLLTLGAIIIILMFIYGCFVAERRQSYREIAEEYGSLYGVDVDLIDAVMKAESNYRADAVSPKEAKGLMQLMDSTAEYVRKMLGETGSYDLFSPRDNIRYGTYYLKYLLEKFPVTETAIAAYNAGEGNVTSWLNNKDYSSDKRTLNVIPFSETENYVKKVMDYYND